MPARNVKSKGLFSFGTGVAVGFGAGLAMKVCFPKAMKLPGLIMKRLGFEPADLLSLFWDADESLDGVALPAAKTKPKAKKRQTTSRAKRAVKAPERFVPSPVVKGVSAQDAWQVTSTPVRRAPGLRLKVEVPYGKRRSTKSIVQSAHPRRMRGRVLASVN